MCALDIGTNAEYLDGNILEITSLVHKWRAIILIDEADGYLAERSLQTFGGIAWYRSFSAVLLPLLSPPSKEFYTHLHPSSPSHNNTFANLVSGSARNNQ